MILRIPDEDLADQFKTGICPGHPPESLDAVLGSS
jgi:hypothetical protein